MVDRRSEGRPVEGRGRRRGRNGDSDELFERKPLEAGEEDGGAVVAVVVGGAVEAVGEVEGVGQRVCDDGPGRQRSSALDDRSLEEISS